MSSHRSLNLHPLMLWFCVGAAYFVTGQLVISVTAAVGGVSPVVWPPFAIAVAGFILFGPLVGSGCIAGATLLELTSGASPEHALLSGVGVTLGAFVAWGLTVGPQRRPFSIESSTDLWRFALSMLAGSLVAAGLAVTAHLSGPAAAPGDPSALGLLVSLGGYDVGAMIFTPLLVYSIRDRGKPGRIAHVLELTAAMVLLVSVAVVWQAVALPITLRIAATLLAVPLLTWIAFRFGVSDMSMALAVFATSSWLVTLSRQAETAVPVVFSHQFVLGTLGVTGFFVSSMVAEKSRFQENLGLATTVFETAAEGIVVTLPDGEIVDVNDAYARMHGYSREEVIGKNPRILKSDRHEPEFYRAMWESLIATGEWRGEIWDRRADGGVFPKWLSIAARKDERGRVTHYVGVFSDITEIKQAEQELVTMATLDPLTGLANRTLTEDRLANALAHARREGTLVGVLFIDLDHFKHVNDTLGHLQGDGLLSEVGRRLSSILREEDTVGRRGGDEFTMIVPNVGNVSALENLAARLIEAIGSPYHLGLNEAHVTASIGIAVFPSDGEDAATLIQRADIAMYRAKESGRDRSVFFSAEIQEEFERRVRIENDLRRAIADERLFLHYQPQVDLATGRIVGAEALVRLRSEDGTLIPPDDFIPVAEDSGLIVPLGDWVLRAACADLALLRAAGHDLTVAVNFSARQFRDLDIASFIVDVLQFSGLEPSDLEVEITETSLMHDASGAADKIRDLQEAGIRVALDDFGTGYSSLTYLHRFRVSKLKIDRSFITGLPSDTDSQAIVLATVALAKGVGACVVAEGLETEEQVGFLRMIGCDYGQGYHFSRPVPLGDLMRTVSSEPFVLPDVRPS